MNIVINHITNSNKYEKDLVSKMGGNVIVTEADKLFLAGKEEGLAESQKIITEKKLMI